MKKYAEINFEKYLSKYLFTKTKINSKRKKENLPTSLSSENTKVLETGKKIDLLESKDNNFFNKKDQFLSDSKLKITENPFLSSIKKNQNFSMKLDEEKDEGDFLKFGSRIIMNDNFPDFFENNLEVNKKKLNLFDDDFFKSVIFSNDEIINLELKDNKINNEKKEEKQKNLYINNALGNLIDKEKIVIEALTSLDNDYMNNGEHNNAMINFEDFDSEKNYFDEIFDISVFRNDSEEKKLEYEQKKLIYEIIDKRIKFYYNYYKKNKSYQIKETEIEIKNFQNDINNILNIESSNDIYLYFGFKSIVISLYILIIRWLSNSHFKIYLRSIKENNINLDIFIELMEKYNKIKDICPFLEKDFKGIIDNYHKMEDIKFCLCELLTDLYWDYVFKIHKINYMFTSCYKLENIKNNVIFEEAKHSMKSIIDLLILNNTCYKKNIGEQLQLPYMKKENIFLISYINKSMKIVNPFEIKNPFIVQNEKNSENSEKENCNNDTPNLSDENNNNNDKNLTNDQNKDEEKEDNTEKNEEKNKEKNKNTDNLSLEEIYKFIVEDIPDENKKQKKKKRKKKKKIKIKKLLKLLTQLLMNLSNILLNLIKIIVKISLK
jgi:hypothetical protein